MAIIKPFKSFRPDAKLAAQVSALPYDVMNSEEAKTMAAGNPFSFLHISKAEIDLDEGIDVHSDIVYNRAKENLQLFFKNGTLLQDVKEHYYIYAQTMNGRRQFGLVACSSIEDYFNNVIKKHEFTRPEKELDRINHMKKIEAHVGPIFLTYPDNSGINEIVSSYVKQNPVYDFIADDGIGHTVWIISEEKDIQTITSIFSTEIPFTYIADGHHRTASAAKVGAELRANNPQHNGNEEYNYFLSVLFPASQLAIMDYNRVVKDLNGNSVTEFLEKVSSIYNFEKTMDKKPSGLHTVSMYLNGEWYSMKVKPEFVKDDPIGVLDVTILQEHVLAPILNIIDPRTDKRIDFVGGIRGLGELEKRVNSGEMAVAFALYPVTLQQLIDIADSGNVMPPKSTWFEPKLRDGLFVHIF